MSNTEYRRSIAVGWFREQRGRYPFSFDRVSSRHTMFGDCMSLWNDKERRCDCRCNPSASSVVWQLGRETIIMVVLWCVIDTPASAKGMDVGGEHGHHSIPEVAHFPSQVI